MTQTSGIATVTPIRPQASPGRGLSQRALATRSAWAIQQMPENSPEQRAALREHSLRFASLATSRSCAV